MPQANTTELIFISLFCAQCVQYRTQITRQLLKYRLTTTSVVIFKNTEPLLI